MEIFPRQHLRKNGILDPTRLDSSIIIKKFLAESEPNWIPWLRFASPIDSLLGGFEPVESEKSWSESQLAVGQNQ